MILKRSRKEKGEMDCSHFKVQMGPTLRQDTNPCLVFHFYSLKTLAQQWQRECSWALKKRVRKGAFSIAF